MQMRVGDKGGGRGGEGTWAAWRRGEVVTASGLPRPRLSSGSGELSALQPPSPDVVVWTGQPPPG